MDAAGRAADLLERLEALGLAGGLTEEDLFGDSLREPLLTCCASLADALACLPCDDGLVDEPAHLAAAAANVKAVCASQRGASNGRLASALARLARAIDASAAGASSRVEQLELAVAHLQAARMLARHRQAAAAAGDAPQAAAAAAAADMEVDEGADEAATARLRQLARLLRLDASRSRALPILQELLPHVSSLLARLPPGFFQPLAGSSADSLTEGQQALLAEVDSALQAEYRLRRRMLIERIKVTLQSLLWSPRIAERGTRGEVEALIASCQGQLQEAPAVSVADVAAVSAAQLAGVMRKATSGEGGSFDTSVKRVIIGKVPDRGGRPEGRSRAASMPDWAPRRESSGGDGGGGHRGGGRGGRAASAKRSRGDLDNSEGHAGASSSGGGGG